jgi:hypothetical protein
VVVGIVRTLLVIEKGLGLSPGFLFGLQKVVLLASAVLGLQKRLTLIHVGVGDLALDREQLLNSQTLRLHTVQKVVAAGKRVA